MTKALFLEIGKALEVHGRHEMNKETLEFAVTEILEAKSVEELEAVLQALESDEAKDFMDKKIASKVLFEEASAIKQEIEEQVENGEKMEKVREARAKKPRIEPDMLDIMQANLSDELVERLANSRKWNYKITSDSEKITEQVWKQKHCYYVDHLNGWWTLVSVRDNSKVRPETTFIRTEHDSIHGKTVDFPEIKDLRKEAAAMVGECLKMNDTEKTV